MSSSRSTCGRADTRFSLRACLKSSLLANVTLQVANSVILPLVWQKMLKFGRKDASGKRKWLHQWLYISTTNLLSESASETRSPTSCTITAECKTLNGSDAKRDLTNITVTCDIWPWLPIDSKFFSQFDHGHDSSANMRGYPQRHALYRQKYHFTVLMKVFQKESCFFGKRWAVFAC